MQNTIYIATALNRHVRIYIANTKKLCEDARKTHNLFPTSLAALGRVLSINALMAAMLKNENESISIEINGGGPIGTILSVSKGDGSIKGFVGDPCLHINYNDSHKLAVGYAVGKNGYLKVRKDINLKAPFTGQIALKSGEIGEDFAYYFMLSEQRATIVSVGVLVDIDYSCKQAGAMIIELLPNHDDKDIEYLEKLQKELRPISSLFDSGKTSLDILNNLFDDIEILDKKEIKWLCDCSKERFLSGLLTLNKNDLKELTNDEKIEIKCEFCNKIYQFTKEDILKLI